MIGEWVGNYRVIDRIGSGGMGVVYLAEHPVLRRRVALKVLRAEYGTNKDLIERFFSEARALNAIRHPHIVEVFDLGQTAAGAYYLTMELLEGDMLSQRMKLDGPFTPSTAVRICSQAAAALGAAHAEGIIHRDVKPQNMFLIRREQQSDYLKLVDFGIAKLIGSGEGELTRSGQVVGTPRYMSPEHCAGRREIDHRSDIYSLGVVLYEMVTGRPPFEGGTGELFAAHLREAPPPPREFRADLPEALDQALLVSLAKDPNQRFQTMDEFRRALGGEIRVTPAPFPAAADPAPEMSTSRRMSLGATPPPRAGPDTLRRSGYIPTTAPRMAGEARVRTQPPAFRSRLPLYAAGVAGAAIATIAIVVAATSPRGAASGAPSRGPAHETSASAPASPAAPSPTSPSPAAMIQLRVESDPAGAEVLRAGESAALGVTPLEVSLPATDAPFQLVVRKQGFRDETRTIDPRSAEGGRRGIHVLLRPADGDGRRPAGAKKRRKKLFTDL